MSKRIAALPYVGGKYKVGAWIASQFPQHDRYIEPFGGMCNVLLNKPRVPIEIYNDFDKAIYNWWVAVRDHRDDLIEFLESTPWAQESLAWAIDVRDNPDSHKIVERAAATSIIATQTPNQNQQVKHAEGGNWRFTFQNAAAMQDNWRRRIEAVAKRMRSVQLFNSDAITIIDRCLKDKHHPKMIYLDPPYAKTDNSKYGVKDFDRDALLERITSTDKHFFAMSGYPDNWPELEELGWSAATKQSRAQLGQWSRNPDTKRVEVLWTSYAPPGQHRLC